VNLDGVVSRTAHRAYVSGRLDEHMRRRGVTHVAEWAVGYQDIVRVSAPEAFRLEPLAVGPRQDAWQYILSRVHWSATPGRRPEP
jgi:hypothetical protein